MNFLKRRQLRKQAHEVIRQARHVRNMRGDLLKPGDLDALVAGEGKVTAALKAKDVACIEKEGEALHGLAVSLIPRRVSPGLRENVEIVAVAIAVAMGFRAYFLQPFKIPTGSMQPTLYGIHTEARSEPGFTDKMLFRPIKWLLFGSWYREIKTELPGVLSGPVNPGANHPTYYLYRVGSRSYKVPRQATVRFRPGAYVPAGETLWAGVVTAGDHIFVDKVRWNFMRPKRGEIMVFETDGIDGLPPGTHYIKRMCGLPNESLEIRPPELLIDGASVDKPDGIARIARRDEGYGGYLNQGELRAGVVAQLGDGEYFALGDNTGNSRDSRYWGVVPRSNLVGPALLVYWPLSKRWGLAR